MTSINMLLFLQLCQLIVLELINCGLITGTEEPAVSGNQTTEASWCGQTDNGYSCVARQGQQLKIPCGDFYQQRGLSFTYYAGESQQILATDLTDYFTMYPEWNDTGLQICCAPNISISVFDIPCYKLSVLYPPREDSITWPTGISKWPVYGNPFVLECPLISNPSSTYTWKKFSSLDRKEEINFSNDVKFLSNGKKWKVESYSGNDNGVYVCMALNQLGTETYSDDSLFFLQANRTCPHSSSDNASVHVPTSETLYYKPEENITLTCTANSVLTYGMKPYWFFKNNGTLELCRPPFYNSQEPRRDSETCVWTNSLVVREFSKELAGDYYCRYGKQSALQTVGMEACYTYEHNNVTVSISQPTFIEVASNGKGNSNLLITCIVTNVTPLYEVDWMLSNAMGKCNETNHSICDSEQFEENQSRSAAMYEVTSSYDELSCRWMVNMTIDVDAGDWRGTYDCVVRDLDRKSIVARKTLRLNETIMFVRDTEDNNNNNNNEIQTRTTSIAVGVVSAVVLVLIILPVLAWIRLKYRRPSFSRSREPERKGFTYDVFISAHDETRDLVYKNILLPLEQDSNPPYKVCWHLRDFTAGVPIAEQIADAVKQSRKIIFVFSGRFSESKFCQLELDQAIHRLITSRTRCLVPIALNEEAVPKKLKNILTYWPVVLASEHKWIERIKQLIGDPIVRVSGNNYSNIIHGPL